MPLKKDVIVDVSVIRETPAPNPPEMLYLYFSAAELATPVAYQVVDSLGQFRSNVAGGGTTHPMDTAVAAYFAAGASKRLAIMSIVDSTDVSEALDAVYSNRNGFFTMVATNLNPLTTAGEHEAGQGFGSLLKWCLNNNVYLFTRLSYIDGGTNTDAVTIKDIEILNDEGNPIQLKNLAVLVAKAGESEDTTAYQKGDTEQAHVKWASILVNSSSAVTMKFKTLTGVTPIVYGNQDVALTALHAAGINTYVDKMGYDMTSEGLDISTDTTAGTDKDPTAPMFIDVVYEQVIIQRLIEQSVQALLVTSPKLPYTQHGLNRIGIAIRDVLTQRFQYGSIASVGATNTPDFVVTVPSIRTQTGQATRTVSGFSWKMKLSGAIHSGYFTGYIVV